MNTLRTDIRIACIGCGTMGSAIMQAVMQMVAPSCITVSGGESGRARDFAKKTGCSFAASNAEAAAAADVVFIAVKPAAVPAVLKEIRHELHGKTLVSMAAGVPLCAVRELCAHESVRCVRIMPNTPVSVGEGMIALSGDETTPPEVCTEIAALLAPAGKVEIIPELLIDCAGAVSGCGPAYCFLFIESLADAAVLLGMPRRQAYTYAAQTLKGAAELVLRTGTHPAALKDSVCSPGGTTIEAVKKLEEGGFRAAVLNAVQAAYDKTLLLAKKR